MAFPAPGRTSCGACRRPHSPCSGVRVRKRFAHRKCRVPATREHRVAVWRARDPDRRTPNRPARTSGRLGALLARGRGMPLPGATLRSRRRGGDRHACPRDLRQRACRQTPRPVGDRTKRERAPRREPAHRSSSSRCYWVFRAETCSSTSTSLTATISARRLSCSRTPSPVRTAGSCSPLAIRLTSSRLRTFMP